jgi:hypothetical protein
MQFVDLRSHLVERQFAIDVPLKNCRRLGARCKTLETQASHRFAVVLLPFGALFLTEGEDCRHCHNRLYFYILPFWGCRRRMISGKAQPPHQTLSAAGDARSRTVRLSAFASAMLVLWRRQFVGGLTVGLPCLAFRTGTDPNNFRRVSGPLTATAVGLKRLNDRRDVPGKPCTPRFRSRRI